jgi:hypothetical protein
MPNLLEQSVRLQKRRLDAVAGKSGAYGRGIEAKEGLVAIPRLPRLGTQDIGAEALLTAEELDWMFTADELVLDGQQIEPAKGDWWRYQRSDGKFATYTAINDPDGRAYSHSDHFGVLIRVHMHLTKVGAPPV